MGGEQTNAYMICTDGYSRVFCLIENVLCELERVCEIHEDDIDDDRETGHVGPCAQGTN